MGNLGIYTSYDEQLNGHIQEAVDISVESGYLIWLVSKRNKSGSLQVTNNYSYFNKNKKGREIL